MTLPLECVWRSLVTAGRLEFALGPQLTRYIAAHGAALRAEDLAEAQQAHFGCRRWDADELLAELRTVGADEWEQAVAEAERDLHETSGAAGQKERR